MNNVEKIASNADEKPVHSTTSTKISQTWLASHTGPIAQSMSSRGRRPRSLPPASRLQTPAPKSAPPKTAYIVTPISSTTATASALLTARRPRDGRRQGVVGPVRHVVLVLVRLAPPPRHRPQRDDQHRAQHDVERDHGDERHPDPAGLRDRVLRAHHVVDDPRLAPDLGHDPAALERHDRRQAGDGDRAQEPLRLRDVAPAPPDDAEPRAERDQHRADPDHRVERPVQHRVGGRPVVGRDGVEPGHLRARAPARRGTSRTRGSRSRP